MFTYTIDYRRFSQLSAMKDLYGIVPSVSRLTWHFVGGYSRRLQSIKHYNCNRSLASGHCSSITEDSNQPDTPSSICVHRPASVGLSTMAALWWEWSSALSQQRRLIDWPYRPDAFVL